MLVVDLDLQRELPLVGRANPKEVERLMRQAPDLEDSLMNWDEDPERAFKAALAAMLKQTGPKAVFESVWYDFYRDDPAAYLRNVAALGYGGSLIPREDENGESIVHIVMYDVNKIRIVETR